MSEHKITVFLDTDGYVAYFNDFRWISAGGDTEEEALSELINALHAAKSSFSSSPNSKVDLSLSPVAA